MLLNYFKVAFRNLTKQGFYSLINIVGLAVGIACCAMIVLYVQDELSYDQHHEHINDLYRVGADIAFGQMDDKLAVVSAPMAEALVADYPEVINAGRFRSRGSYLVRPSGTEVDNIKEVNLQFADPSIFEMLTIPVLQGDAVEGLKAPNTIAIAASKAEKYFPDQNPIGQQLTLDNRFEYKVVAVVEDMPHNSHMQVDFFLSMETLEESKQAMWVSHNFHTYLQLAPGTDPAALEAKFPDMVRKYVGPQVEQFLQIDLDQFEEKGGRMAYFLQPMGDIYLHSDVVAEIGKVGDITYVWLFGAIALFILFIACINFMNLSTARSANRAREVGIRKVLGSYRSHLIWQFLIEAFMVSFGAIMLAVGLMELMIPAFNDLSGKALSVPWSWGGFIPLALLLSLVIGLMAGLYPAFFLSGFQPIKVLKGRYSRGAGSSWLRSTLVVFQFATSIILIIGTVIIYQQLNFVQEKRLGFEKDQVIMINDAYALGDQIKPFRDEITALPNVQNASISGFLPVDGTNRNNTVFWPRGDQSQESKVLMQNWTVDHNYIPTLGLEVVDGRAFSIDFPTDSQGIILNETAVRNFGYEDPIGEQIDTYSSIGNGEEAVVSTYTVIGVVSDFHYETLRNKVGALCLFIGDSRGLISVQTKGEDVSTVLAQAKAKWENFAPGQPFDYAFLDERFTQMYETEQRVGDIFAVFAGLAILIACLGLFALAAFMAEQRHKEIGIRKVLGASFREIILLLSEDFVKLVVISLVVAIPISLFGMHTWLQDYAYRINLGEIGPWSVAIAALLTGIITLITVSGHAIRAALTSPVHALRDE